ncbi:hypothetical protein VKT23_009857 [Stygiomarasmius scandens]|uniref:Uncharacterized protein n=1 Tax=Marasmiellus scandens TaxID=2682957 RepID=A0ABR1JDJ0_9AGAR
MTPTLRDLKPSQSELTGMLGALHVLQNDPTLDSGPDYSQSNLQFVPYTGAGPVPNEEKWLRTLDTIATCLSTGTPGESYAVSANTNQRLSFLIAKTSKITVADDKAVKELSALITSRKSWEMTSTVYVRDFVFPHLIRRCRAAMHKSIQQLHSSMCSYNWELAIRRFSWERGFECGTISGFFPGSEEYRKRMKKKGKTISVKDMVHMLVEDIIETCQSSDLAGGSEQLRNMDGPETVLEQGGQTVCAKEKYRIQVFHNLAHYCKVLRKSKFMGFLTSEDSIFLDPSMRVEAIELQRKLKKICQFVYGVRRLVSNARKFFPDGSVSYEWIESVGVNGDHGQTISTIHDLLERAFQQITREVTLHTQKSNILSRYPHLSDPPAYQSILQIHPELKILLHFITSGLPEFADPCISIPIGKDSSVCWCCAEWINTWMRSNGGKLRFVVTYLENKISKDWAVPSSIFKGPWNDIDAVNWTVGRRIEKRFCAMIKNASKAIQRDQENHIVHLESYSPLPSLPSRESQLCPRRVSLSDFHFDMEPISAAPEIRLNGIPINSDCMTHSESKFSDRYDGYLEFGQVPMELDNEDMFAQSVVQMKGILQVLDDGSGKEEPRLTCVYISG